MSRKDTLDQIGFERYFVSTRKGKKVFAFRYKKTRRQYLSPHSFRRASSRIGVKSEEEFRAMAADALEKGKQWFQIEDPRISELIRSNLHPKSGRILLYYNGIVWVFGPKNRKGAARDLITVWKPDLEEDGRREDL